MRDSAGGHSEFGHRILSESHASETTVFVATSLALFGATSKGGTDCVAHPSSIEVDHLMNMGATPISK